MPGVLTYNFPQDLCVSKLFNVCTRNEVCTVVNLLDPDVLLIVTFLNYFLRCLTLHEIIGRLSMTVLWIFWLLNVQMDRNDLVYLTTWPCVTQLLQFVYRINRVCLTTWPDWPSYYDSVTAVGCYGGWLTTCLCSWSRAVTVYVDSCCPSCCVSGYVYRYHCSIHLRTRSLYHTCGLLSHLWLEAGSPTAASTWCTC